MCYMRAPLPRAHRTERRRAAECTDVHVHGRGHCRRRNSRGVAIGSARETTSATCGPTPPLTAPDEAENRERF